MDILTPAGQKTVADEQRAQDIFQSNFPHLSYVHTPKNRPADVDAVIVISNRLCGVVETKCRYDIDLEGFIQRYRCRWLVTMEKVEKGALMSGALCVPFVGFLYLKQSDVLLMQTIYDNGGYVPEIRVEDTVTQRTVNGGLIKRTNAFIDMGEAKLLRMKNG